LGGVMVAPISGCFSPEPLPVWLGHAPSSTPLLDSVRVSWHMVHGPQQIHEK
jgi:hypothetical protein